MSCNFPRCHIVYPFRPGPWGGSNSFLSALRQQLEIRGAYADSPDDADVFLIDSFNEARSVLALRKMYPDIPFVHRIDGPISIYRGKHRYMDRLVYALHDAAADAAIFQSRYSQAANTRLGMSSPRMSRVIYNAARSEYIRPATTSSKPGNILQIIAVSWSANWNKGFDVYHYLDRNLDTSRYEMIFVGHSPIQFVNIKHIPPQTSCELVRLLQASDLYLTASRHESCSNSLLEALACGLPCAAIDSGSNAELLGDCGKLFYGVNDVLNIIDEIAANLSKYKDVNRNRGIMEAADEYISFMSEVINQSLDLRGRGGAFSQLCVHTRLLQWHISELTRKYFEAFRSVGFPK